MTRTQELVAAKLREPLDEFVTARREAGESWDHIAARITYRTKVTVNGETVRRWYKLPEKS